MRFFTSGLYECGRCCLIALTIVCAALLCAVTVAAEVYPGQAAFNAGPSIISMPKGMVALVFDTSQCDNCRDSLPSWRFIGNLKVEAVKLYAEGGRGVPVELTDPAQLDGIRIESTELISVLQRLKVVELIKRAPMFAPSDTLFWDSVTVRWVKNPDISKSYRLLFDESIEPDSAVHWLQQVSGMSDANKLDIPHEPYEPRPAATSK